MDTTDDQVVVVSDGHHHSQMMADAFSRGQRLCLNSGRESQLRMPKTP
jgi:hypothetical protein